VAGQRPRSQERPRASQNGEDKLDAIWLAKLNERGMLRSSFVPPVEIRQLPDYTRLRADLTGERSRHIQRVEKLLEALIKLSSAATNIMGVSSRAMQAAMIAGERDPRVLAELAKGRLRGQESRPHPGTHRTLR
jgi:transposase